MSNFNFWTDIWVNCNVAQLIAVYINSESFQVMSVYTLNKLKRACKIQKAISVVRPCSSDINDGKREKRSSIYNTWFSKQVADIMNPLSMHLYLY